ncbi:urease accessory protein UreD [Lipingzhangella sp. LS1_29]|uniref:Urease accessory protein UreD n=1 Tax=Lipingzhangella rawalii TaxID=2055835 RepID=A0ABU2H3K0_9ACTN|nr:urease accessory protein UreD [Lipingzhangella rawalii]MDS1269430.1 urease accessory protein UreD [Lipingzhangella rawalii]
MSIPQPTRIVVDADPCTGHSRTRVLQPGRFLAPRPLRPTGAAARIALVGTRASLCAGDELELHVEADVGSAVELVDPGGTVAYHMRGGRARWEAHITLARGSRLAWREQPFVVSTGATVHRGMHAELDADARLLCWETLVLGRGGEDGGTLDTRTRVHQAGAELLAEDLDLRAPDARQLPGILGPHRVLGQVTLVGTRPPEAASPQRLDLADPGALQRQLCASTHVCDAQLAPVWQRWRELL